MNLSTIPVLNVPKVIEEKLDATQRQQLKAEAKQLLIEKNAVLVAHYYTAADLQDLAEETGGCVSDSLDMAKFGQQHDASTLVVAGVKFMGDTAKILSPEKKILMPDLNANCSLDLSCEANAFNAFCEQYPDRTVVVYANTSAEVKARADWVVTSGIALKIVTHLQRQGKKILWAPDRYLGDYIQRNTQADMILWQGSCVVHEAFKAKKLQTLMQKYPEAAILVHPESPAEVIQLADVVGSTTRLIDATKVMKNQMFIIATDNGILHKMRQYSPHKTFLEAPTAGEGATCLSCAHCPWMAMNGLQNLVTVLKTGENEIILAPEIQQKALISVQRMMHFATTQSLD